MAQARLDQPVGQGSLAGGKARADGNVGLPLRRSTTVLSPRNSHAAAREPRAPPRAPLQRLLRGKRPKDLEREKFKALGAYQILPGLAEVDEAPVRGNAWRI